MSRQSRRVFNRGGLLATILAPGFLTPWKPARADGPPSEDGPELTLKDLNAALRSLQAKYDALTQNLNSHSVFDPPIGTVAGFAGPWAPINPATGEKHSEIELGWALCDGRPFTHPTLEEAKATLENELGRLLGRAAEPAMALPNYCGVFLRGLDLTIDGGTTGRDKGFPGTPTRKIGKEQGWATAMPLTPFANSTAPNHTHRIPTYVGGDQWGKGLNEVGMGAFPNFDYQNSPPTEGAGEHTPAITGGDLETRPINVAVHYIIKFRSTQGK